jgi:hypothetical protein
MVFAPLASEVPGTVMEQVPALSVQLPSDAELVVSVNVTVPVGLSAGTLLSLTVAATVLLWPALMLFGVAVTLVVVTSAVSVSVVVPEDAPNSLVTPA